MHHRSIDFGGVAVPLFHAAQKCGLVATIENQLRILDLGNDLKKFMPNVFLVYTAICPKGSLYNGIGARNSQANEVVRVTIRHSFNVNINGGACNRQLWLANDVDSLLPNCESLESVEVLDCSGIRSP